MRLVLLEDVESINIARAHLMIDPRYPERLMRSECKEQKMNPIYQTFLGILGLGGIFLVIRYFEFIIGLFFSLVILACFGGMLYNMVKIIGAWIGSLLK